MLAIEGRDEFAAVQIGLRKHRHANRLFELSLDRGRRSTDARRIDAAAQGRIRFDFDDGPACTDNELRRIESGRGVDGGLGDLILDRAAMC